MVGTSMKVYTVLVGNKCDDNNREVETFESEDMAEKHGSLFYECSAKTGKNINDVFEDVAWKLYLNLKSKAPFVDGHFVNGVKLSPDVKPIPRYDQEPLCCVVL